jgi:hypothetical protein
MQGFDRLCNGKAPTLKNYRDIAIELTNDPNHGAVKYFDKRIVMGYPGKFVKNEEKEVIYFIWKMICRENRRK